MELPDTLAEFSAACERACGPAHVFYMHYTPPRRWAVGCVSHDKLLGVERTGATLDEALHAFWEALNEQG